jgi:hypothetical protein
MNCAWLKSTAKLTVQGLDPTVQVLDPTVQGLDPTVQTKLLQTIDILWHKLIGVPNYCKFGSKPCMVESKPCTVRSKPCTVGSKLCAVGS